LETYNSLALLTWLAREGEGLSGKVTVSGSAIPNLKLKFLEKSFL
jgi:hypothetical protein